MITKETLLIEYGIALRQMYAIQNEKKKLLKGSLQKKHIGNNDYYYLAERISGKVVTKYINADEVDIFLKQLDKRKMLISSFKEYRNSKELIEKALGRVVASTEHIKHCVNNVVNNNPQFCIEKVTLFGSRANGKFNQNSDVDLMIRFKENSHITLWGMSSLRLKLIDELGLDVDLIEDNPKLLPGIKIEKTKVIYESN